MYCVVVDCFFLPSLPVKFVLIMPHLDLPLCRSTCASAKVFGRGCSVCISFFSPSVHNWRMCMCGCVDPFMAFLFQPVAGWLDEKARDEPQPPPPLLSHHVSIRLCLCLCARRTTVLAWRGTAWWPRGALVCWLRSTPSSRCVGPGMVRGGEVSR